MEIINKKEEKQLRNKIINTNFEKISEILNNYNNINNYFSTLNKKEKNEFYINFKPCYEYILKYAKENYIPPFIKNNNINFFINYNDKVILIGLNDNNEFNIKYIEKNNSFKVIMYNYLLENKKLYSTTSINECLNSIMNNINSLQIRGFSNEYIIEIIKNKMLIEKQKKTKIK